MDIRDFLARLHVESGPNAKGEYMCNCPAHDDKNASLSVKDGEKGIVLHCQTKRCSAGDIVKSMGLEMRDLFHEQREGGQPAPAAKAAKPAAKPGKGKKPWGKFVCAYPYRDETGKLLFEACRYHRDDGSKTFSLRQPDPAKPGEYINSKDGVRLVLYRLPEVCAAIKAGKPVFVVEGEKDCDNMAALGYTATTNPMGAGKWHAGDYTPSLKGADLYIIPDNDDVGRDHAQTVAQAAVKLAKSVRVLDLTKGCAELPEKGDISDFYKLLGKKPGNDALQKLMREAEPYDGKATYASGGMSMSEKSRSTREKYTSGEQGSPYPDFSGDALAQRAWTSFMHEVMATARAACKAGAVLAMFVDWRQLPALTDAIQWAGWTWRGVAVWDKQNSRPQMGRFRQQCEYIVWGSNGPLPVERGVGVLPGLFSFPNVPTQERWHQTQKPLALMRHVVQLCEPGGVVLDPFAGSGSTMEAALLEGYEAVGIELEQHNVDIIRKRLEGVQVRLDISRPSGEQLKLSDFGG